MKKADKERLFALLDEAKSIIHSYKLLNRKDIYTLVNELTVLRLDVEGLQKGFSWEEAKNEK